MTTTMIVRPLNLDLLRLDSGTHHGPDNGEPGNMCLLEACAWMAGEPWSDHPQCVSPVLGAFGRRLNDALPADKRQRLVPLIPAMLGTAGDGLDEVRRHMAVDWSVRVAAPLWLDAAGRAGLAAELRGLAPIVDRAGREAIRSRLREISDECWSARREVLAKVRAKVANAAADAVANAAAVANAVANANANAVANAAADAVAVAVADAAAVANAAADAAAAAAADADAVANAVADANAAADAAAVAVAVANAAAAAAAAAAAVAAADAVAVAVADAVAARGASLWRETYDRVYRETKAQIKATYEPTKVQVQDSAIELFTAMVRPVAS